MSFCKKLHEFGEKNFSQIKEDLMNCQLQEPKTRNTLKSRIKENFIKKSSSSSTLCSVPTSSTSVQDEENVLSDIVSWRRAIAEDVPAIRQLQALTGDTANLLYRKINNIDEIIDKSFLSIVQYNAKGNLISFTAYDSYPDIPSIQIFWDDWMTLNYRFNDVSPRNALFIHYMLWLPDQANKFLPLLLESIFSEFIYVKHIIIIKPPNAIIPEFCRNYFIPLLPPALNELEYDSIQSILICLRTSIIHPLRIRSAFYLLAVVAKVTLVGFNDCKPSETGVEYSGKLSSSKPNKMSLMEFNKPIYFSEYELDIITSTIRGHFQTMGNPKTCGDLDLVNFFYQKNNKTLICEFEGELAGIMILNLKIDLDFLNEGFELAPFNGLRKKNFLDQNSDLNSTVTKHSPIKLQECPNLLKSSEFLFSQLNWEIMLSKKKFLNSPCTGTSKSAKSDSTLNESSEFSLVTLSSVVGSTDLNKKKAKTECMINYEKHEIFPKTDIKVAFRTSGMAMTHFFSSKHLGQSNAFAIDFFAIDCNKVDEKLSSFDFLEAAFKNVPDRDYCVLIIPTDYLPFPLLDLFVRVTPRPMASFNQELYLCHKKSLSVISMSVRSAEEDDLADINYFLRHVDEGDAVYQDIINLCFMNNNDFQSFILSDEKKIIGVSLINRRDSIEHFHMRFNVADLTPIELNRTGNGSIIRHLIINPKYHHHARFFLRDIMRLADASRLYYVKNKSSKVQCSVMTILGEFCPVKPKKKAGLDELFWTAHLPISEEKKSKDSFGLYFMNPRLCGLSKIDVNFIIIVVGASRTSLAFLESLIFGAESKFICYNNLICVTPHELEAESDQLDINFMFPIRDNFSRDYLSMLSLETYVNFIYGVMTGINRSEKYIVVNNKNIIRYDYLILTCGLQYLPPKFKTKETYRNGFNKNFRSSLARFLLPSAEQKKIYVPRHASNMYLINTENDAKNAIQNLQYLLDKSEKVSQDKKIIVYGHDLHVFLTIHTLLKLGIPGDLIVFVEPFPTKTKTVTLFNDPSVDKAVLETVLKCNIKYYKEYFLYDWSLSSDDDRITSITFHSRRTQLVIPCLAFFPFLEKLVSDVTFNACIEAGLVYDGRLVINHNFRTNDNYIYAAGPLTKYAKRYFANDRDHQYFNSREVGEKLAEIIKKKVDPATRVENEKESDLVPKMKSPVFLYCQMPEDYNLFILRKPGKELDLETAFNFVNYGEVLTTGDCKMKTGYGYFRLHLDSEGFVQSITCYTKNKIDYLNLPSLYGLHEKLLNNLLFRYDMSMIPDFFDYFRQPWALALFHENFQLLKDYNIQSFYQCSSESINFPNEVDQKLQLNNWKPLSDAIKKEIANEYLYSASEEEIKNNVLQFLEYYQNDLPVYAIPSKVDRLNYEKTNP